MQINILEYLEQTVKRVPDKLAFAGQTEYLTFSQLFAQSRALGTALLRDGAYRQPVVVFMKKQPKTVAAFLGVIYSGCFYVPMDEEMPQYRIAMLLHQLHPVACICDETTLPMAEALPDTGRLYLYDPIAAGEADDAALQAVRARQIDTDPIYVVFTSGSTGTPKGVVGCHRAVIDYIENLCPVLKCDENTVFGNQTPLYFDACLKEIIPTLKYGATTYLISRRLFLFPVRLVEYLNEKKINTLCWVASALTYISSLRTFETVRPSHLHTIAFASEVFPIRQLKLWQAALPDARFLNLYGPTETTGICCCYEVDREFGENEVLPVGHPLPNTDILLLDESNRIPPLGEPGEICIRGSRLTRGYYSDPERTAERFVQNPLNPWYPERIYRTGDMGKYNHRGELVFLSRKDSQFKHMGHRIEPGEIEAVANAHEGVSCACCVFDPAGKKIVLFYVGEITGEALKAALKEKLPRYMLPHIFRRLEAMPLTPNGKLDRNYLTQRSKENG